MLRAISSVAARAVAADGPKRPISSEAIFGALRGVLGGDRGTHAVNFMCKAFVRDLKFDSDSIDGGDANGPEAPEPGSDEDGGHPGLQFQPTALAAELRSNGAIPNAMLNRYAEVHLAACLEYLTAEIMQLAGCKMMDDKNALHPDPYDTTRRCMSAQHVIAGISGDKLLSALLSSVISAGGKAKAKNPASPARNARRRASAVA